MSEEESSDIRRYLEKTVEFTPSLEINLLHLPSLSFNQWSRNKNSMHKDEFSAYAFSKIFESGREEIENLRSILANNGYEEAGIKITKYLKARVENPPSNREKIKVVSFQSTLTSTGVNSGQEGLTENERNKRIFPVVNKLTTVHSGTRIPVYPMTKICRGRALVINIESFTDSRYTFRSGSRLDEEKLNSLLKQLGFQVTLFPNISRKELYNLIQETTRDKDLGNCEMMIVCVLSHGEEGTIITSDSHKVCIEKEIIRKFNNENCDTLRGKPKLFLFQACRGHDIDYGVVQDSADSVIFQAMGMLESVAIPPVEPKKDVSNSDMLIVYATLPGYVALRDSENGTHFVHSFCKVLAEHAKDTELSDLMYLVSEDLRFNSGDDYKETCVFENRLFKKLYLNPSEL